VTVTLSDLSDLDVELPGWSGAADAARTVLFGDVIDRLCPSQVDEPPDQPTRTR
jgi:hypothetical protein